MVVRHHQSPEVAKPRGANASACEASVTCNCAALMHLYNHQTNTKPTYLRYGGQCSRNAFIVCAMMLQEHDGRDAAVDTRLSQQDSAGVGQQECADDPTHCLSDTACEASGMHDQVDALQSSRMVCYNTYHLTPVYLHTDSKQKMVSLMGLGSVLLKWPRSNAVIV